MKGSKVVFGSQVLKVIIQFFGLVVLSRLVQPQYFGFIALQITILSFLEILRDWGTTTLCLQDAGESSKITVKIRQSWFWVGLFVGISLATAYLLFSITFDQFAHLSNSSLVFAIFASVLLANGLTAQSNIALILSKRFTTISLVEIAAQAVSLFLCISLLNSVGPYLALTIQYCSFLWLSGLLKVALARFNPGTLNLKSANSYFRKGRSLASMSSLNFWNYNFDNLLISTRFGDAALGIYSRAFQIFMVPVAQLVWPLEKVVLVDFAHMERKNISEYLQSLQAKLQLYSTLTFSTLAIVSSFLVPFVLGEEWAASGQILMWLCFSGMFQVPLLINHWAYILSKNNRSAFLLALWRIALYVLLLAFVGNTLEQVPLAILAANILIWVGSSIYLRKGIKVLDSNSVFLGGLTSLVPGLVAYAVCLPIYKSGPLYNSFFGMVIMAFVALAVFTVTTISLKGSAIRNELILLARSSSTKVRRLFK